MYELESLFGDFILLSIKSVRRLCFAAKFDVMKLLRRWEGFVNREML